jgi:pimeloyl-ACP methyl ester carboxylesterase
MKTFVLIPGAGGVAWYWHRVVPLLEKAGHRALPIDLPGDDETKGLDAYVDIVVRAIGDRKNVVLVAQSLGGFTAVPVCNRVGVERLVFVNAMIPEPGETSGAWWDNTGSEKARTEAAERRGYDTKFDLTTYFLHDVPEHLIRDGEKHQRTQSKAIFKDPCRFERWPDVPTVVVVGKDDRFFPCQFQERVARERLNRDILVIDGGHLVALSNPEGLSRCLLEGE